MLPNETSLLPSSISSAFPQWSYILQLHGGCLLDTSQFVQDAQPSVLDVVCHCWTKQDACPPCCWCNRISEQDLLYLQQPSTGVLYPVCDEIFFTGLFLGQPFLFLHLVVLPNARLSSSFHCPHLGCVPKAVGMPGRNLRQLKRCVLWRERVAWRYDDGNKKSKVWCKEIRKGKRKPIKEIKNTSWKRRKRRKLMKEKGTKNYTENDV